MPDEKPVSETFQTIAAEIGALGKLEKRFADLEAKIETSEAETRAEIGALLDQLDRQVQRLYDALVSPGPIKLPPGPAHYALREFHVNPIEYERRRQAGSTDGGKD